MITRKLSTLWLGTLLAFGAGGASALAENAASPLTDWAIDPGHAHVGFSVTHMVVSEVEGTFKKFSGTVQLDEKDPTKSKVTFSAETASINTDNADRDKHLVSPDFFDAAKYPQLSFTSKTIARSGKGYKITGDLTMHGVTKPVTLDATLSEAVTNPWNKQVRAAHLTGVINRNDFGLSWNKSLDKGGVVLGDKVQIDVKLELNK
jgi:polyisoprenoid-binding protein YceI